jgi:hypothetical protein
MKGRDWLFLFEFDIMGAEVAFQFRMIFFFLLQDFWGSILLVETMKQIVFC